MGWLCKGRFRRRLGGAATMQAAAGAEGLEIASHGGDLVVKKFSGL